MKERHLVEGINLALPDPILKNKVDSNIIKEIENILGRPQTTKMENSFSEMIFDAEDQHSLKLLLDSTGSIIAYSVIKTVQSDKPKCPKGWLNNIPQVFGVSLSYSYTGLPFLGFGSLRAYARSRDDASARLAVNVAAALPTLCPGTCPPGCKCIPKIWTAEIINSTHTPRKWRGITIGGTWTSTASLFIRLFCAMHDPLFSRFSFR